jgi:hypothetical protein
MVSAYGFQTPVSVSQGDGGWRRRLPYLEGFRVFKNKKVPLSQMASYEKKEFALSMAGTGNSQSVYKSNRRVT